MDTMAPEPSTVDLGSLPGDFRKRLEEAMAKGSEGPAPDPWVESAEDRQERLAIQAVNRSKRWTARLPSGYANASLDDLEPTQGDIIRGWIRNRASKNLILLGNVGAGKTYAAYAIGNYAVAHGSWVEAWEVYDLLAALRPDGDPHALQRAKDVPLLILDDLGVGKATEWAKDTLTAILGARVNGEGKRTVVTTNVDSVILTENWDQRLVSRLNTTMTKCLFDGDDRRVAW